MAVLGFLGFFTMSSQKMSLQIALVCMVNETAVAILNGEDPPYRNDVITVVANMSTTVAPSANHDKCGQAAEVFNSYVKVNWIEDVSEKGNLVWDKKQRKVIFSTYYLGYLFSQIPAGLLSQRFGGKKVLGFFLLAASGATLLIPFGVRYHYFLLIFLRFVGGVGAGAAFPAMHSILGRWAPPLERSKLASISYAGALTGVLVTYPITSSLCQFGYDDGWPLVFYVVGGSGFLWFGLWISSASDSPLEHKRISKEERKYIIAVLSRQVNLRRTRECDLPYSRMLISLPFLALVVSNFVYDWGLYMFENVIPVFLVEILQMDMRRVTLFAMIPYVSLWICVIMSGVWSDQLRARGVIGTTITRKIFELIGCVIPAAMIVGLGFLECTQWEGAVTMVILGFSFMGFQYNGFLVNHIDVAPRYAAILMAFSNTCGTVTHFLAPYLVENMASEGTKEQWQTVFLCTGCLYLFGLLIFMTCSSGELQPWAANGMTSSTSYGTPSVIDGKRSSKLYNLAVPTPDGDISRVKLGRSNSKLQYQALTHHAILAATVATPNTSKQLACAGMPTPQRQGSMGSRTRYAVSGTRPNMSPYATLPRVKAEAALQSPTSSAVRASGRPPELDGCPTIRKSADLSAYRTFRKSPGDDAVTGRQLLLPPNFASGSSLDRKPSKSNRDSRATSNKNTKISCDPCIKKSQRHSADVSAYDELSESIV
ncbi:hypothetical protein LSH36_36g00015 [Paralvinella palmiformis]|uniref:Major facilitator superfamily (MFS) profile domain-containing protein n=1 Tax=Paralvinella palmiformis TaxID=53620 RepID=A0AAD9K8K3_9ANNE|nr:hypothetical protein LSH36_36g00015 [Paralvinella palmiformis]